MVEGEPELQHDQEHQQEERQDHGELDDSDAALTLVNCSRQAARGAAIATKSRPGPARVGTFRFWKVYPDPAVAVPPMSGISEPSGVFHA